MSDRWLNGSNSESGILRKAKPQHTADAHLDDLLVFGYACKIFRDNDRASQIDHGKHLIPWMGDQSLKIDRYDVRATLSDIRPYEPPAGGYVDRMASLTPAEQRAEQLCEEERYHSLYNNDVEEEMYQDEALKRLHKERSSTYGQVAFDYNAKTTVTAEQPVESTVSEEPDEPFAANPKFYVPPDIEVPDTVKLHAVIEKTAKFIAAQGPQMEILIKAKQSNNPQFEFLNLNNRLNPYYKHVLNAVKHGFYPAEEEDTCDAAEDQARSTPESVVTEPANVPAVVVPQLKYKPSADCSYTQLISKIKGVPIPADGTEARHSPEVQFANDATLQHIMEYRNKFKLSTESTKSTTDKSVHAQFAGRKLSTPLLETPNAYDPPKVMAAPPKPVAIRPDAPKPVVPIPRPLAGPATVEVKKISSGLMLAQCYNSETDDDDDEEPAQPPTAKNEPPVYDFPVPPADLQNIIDKTAAYVLKNGKDFEEILRTKDDVRFSFLKYTDQYYRYYMHKVTGAICAPPKDTGDAKKVDKVITSVSFSIKPKEEGPSLKPTLLREASSDEESESSNTKLPTESESQLTAPSKEPTSVALLPTPTTVAAQSVPLLPTPASACPSTNGHAPVTHTEPAVDVSVDCIRDSVIEINGTDDHRDAKRAEQRVKDRLAQVARDKLGQVTKDKQLQLERRKKAMAFLNQIKPNESDPEQPARIETNGVQQQISVSDDDESVVSVHSVHSSPERPVVVVENGGVVSDDDDDDDDRAKSESSKRKRRKHRRSRSRSKSSSSSSRRHKRKRSKHSKKSKSSRRESRSRSRSSDVERRRRRRSRSRSRSHSMRRSHARSTRESRDYHRSGTSSKSHHHRYRDRS